MRSGGGPILITDRGAPVARLEREGRMSRSDAAAAMKRLKTIDMKSCKHHIQVEVPGDITDGCTIHSLAAFLYF